MQYGVHRLYSIPTKTEQLLNHCGSMKTIGVHKIQIIYMHRTQGPQFYRTV